MLNRRASPEVLARCSLCRVLARIPLTICHHGRHDPRVKVGGVETFARNLGLIFEEVIFSTTQKPLLREVLERRVPVVCDNQTVLDWPATFPLIGFQHGVAAEKVLTTRSWTDLRLAFNQARAARRANTTWLACAPWIAQRFADKYGKRADVIFHSVDPLRFDGQLQNEGSRLVLHDARSAHKGKHLVEILTRAFPQWRFEPLSCAPQAVADRMRKAAAFLHLSRYEGNSIVCNEAMAMNLPCLFTRVGLFRGQISADVELIEVDDAFGSANTLVEIAGRFLQGLSSRSYAPRDWVLQHATLEVSRQRWAEALGRLEASR